MKCKDKVYRIVSLQPEECQEAKEEQVPPTTSSNEEADINLSVHEDDAKMNVS